MRALIPAALLLVAAAPTTADEGTTDYRRLYEALWAAVDQHYYDPHFRGADWRAIGARYRDRAAAVQSDDEFVALAREMLAGVPSSHLFIVRPSRTAGTAGIGASFMSLDGLDIVTEVAPLSDAWRQGLRPGDGLLATDSLRGPLGSRAAVAVEGCDRRRQTLSIRRESVFWPPEHPGFRWRSIRTGDDVRIGYMRIDRFDDGAAELADRAMAELGEARALILDLRGNSGGNASALRLASYFAPGAEASFVLLARPYLEALGHPPTAADIADVPRVSRAYTTEAIMAAVTANQGAAAFWTESLDRPYRRPVFVLIGPETGSAAEGFAWYMKMRTPARLIGRPSAGALLSSETIAIGNGWSVVVPVHGIWGPDGNDFGDRAIEPHVTVAWTRADLCAGRDPDLDLALRLAEEAAASPAGEVSE
jgi:carboxyl-terminal processing protease